MKIILACLQPQADSIRTTITMTNTICDSVMDFPERPSKACLSLPSLKKKLNDGHTSLPVSRTLSQQHDLSPHQARLKKLAAPGSCQFSATCWSFHKLLHWACGCNGCQDLEQVKLFGGHTCIALHLGSLSVHTWWLSTASRPLTLHDSSKPAAVEPLGSLQWTARDVHLRRNMAQDCLHFMRIDTHILGTAAGFALQLQ